MKYIFDDISLDEIAMPVPKAEIKSPPTDIVFEEISLDEIIMAKPAAVATEPDPQAEQLFQIDENGKKFVDFNGVIAYV